MATGTVKWFNATKGFGLIQPDSGGGDVFVHISAVQRARLRGLNEVVAERRARSLALEHAGALAFSRTGDPTTGEFQDAVVLAQFGDVDLDSLSA